MQLKFNIDDLFNLPTAVIYNPDSYKAASKIVIDSREVKKNSIFVAIKGISVDGHKFVKQAEENGAAAVIINKRKLKEFDDLQIPIITVNNTTEAYGHLANIWRHKLGLKVISITGSSGKTSVKEMLAVMLSEKYKVCKTAANNNNHIGVPLSILSAKKNDEILVLEHGTNHFGEIEYSAKIAEPDYAVITNIGNSHIEFLENKNGVFKEKKSLLEITNNNGGKVFINADDKMLRKERGKYQNTVTFGIEENADVKGEITGYTETGFPTVEVISKSKKIGTIIPLLGESSAKNFVTATAVALSLSLTKQNILDAVKKFKPFDKRLNITEAGSCTIINDTYNSNPDSLKSSIEAVSRITNRKKIILILGDMFELGEKGAEIHSKIASSISAKKINAVYTIGKLMKNLDEKLTGKKIINRHFRSRKSLSSFLAKEEMDDSAILIKGSRGMKMEEFVEILTGKN